MRVGGARWSKLSAIVFQGKRFGRFQSIYDFLMLLLQDNAFCQKRRLERRRMHGQGQEFQ